MLTLKLSNKKILSTKCSRRFVHNLGQPNQPYDAAYGSIRCEAVAKTVLNELAKT